MTEQQPYTVVRNADGYELREYPTCVVAEVDVQGEFEQAGSIAFRPLLNYIQGNNQTRQSVAMTAPVVQRQSIDMTAPVIQSSGDAQQHSVAFVLPRSMTLESAPAPADTRVRVREMPGSLTAVARYSGRWSQSSYERHVAALRSAITADGLVAVSEPRFARFDPPFKPWFLRRNEVHIDVDDPTASASDL